MKENVISIKISLKFVPKGPVNKIPALVQILERFRNPTITDTITTPFPCKLGAF